MPLQLRRGTTAERLSIVPLPGEPIYDTDLDTIFIGNGIAAGGISAITGITSEDAQDIVGQMFTNGQHDNVVFTYGSTQDAAGRIDARLDLSIYDGEISASGFRGSLFADDSGLIIDSSTKNISANDISANTITVQTLSVDTLNLTNFAVADIKGSLFADDSTLLVDAVTGTIPYAVLSGAPTALSNFTNDLGFISVADISDGTVTIDVNNTGDLQGSVFADNSTILVDATNSAINLDGTVKGDIIPDANEAYDLGSNANRFKDLYLSGTSLFLGSAQITAAGSAVNLPAGSTVDGVSIGTGSGTGDGVVAGSNYNINIIGEDSSFVVDAAQKLFTGNLIGNVTGNIFTNTIDSSDSSAVNIVPSVVMNSDLIVENEVFVNNNVTANVFVGNFVGNIFTQFIDSADSSSIVFSPAVIMNSDLNIENDLSVANSVTANLFTGRVEGPVYSNLFAEDDNIIINYQTKDITVRNIISQDIRIIQDSSDPNINLDKINVIGSLPSPVIQGDRIGSFSSRGFNGSGFLTGTRILSVVESSSLGTGMPSSLSLQVNSNVDNLETYFKVDGTTDSVTAFKPFSIFDDTYRTNIFGIYQAHDTVDASNISIFRSRGSNASKSAVLSEDDIVDISFLGWNGSSFNPAISMSVIVPTALTGANVPGKIIIRTNNGTTGTVERLSIDHLGNINATGTLNVVGNANISGNTTTDLIGSVFSTTSSLLIDATDSSLMIANINFKGETGNTPSDTVTVDSWLELSVNGVTKYIPLYD